MTANGKEVHSRECNMECSGCKTKEECGGYLRMSAYKMTFGDP